MGYKCVKCGMIHSDWPALAYDAPYQYHHLSEAEKNEIAELTDDFCVIRYEDQIDRFIRATLYQKIIDHCEELNYGIWLSLSEKSFEDYKSVFKKGNKETIYFGFLCNQLPDYDNTLSIKTNVVVSKGDSRPEVVPYDDQIDNPFVLDYYNGITIEEAEQRIKKVLGN